MAKGDNNDVAIEVEHALELQTIPEGINPDFDEVRRHLNNVTSSFPAVCKKDLVKHQRKIFRVLREALQDTSPHSSSEIIENISNIMRTSFENLADTLELSRFNNSIFQLTDSDKIYLLKLVEVFVTTFFYDDFFKLIQNEIGKDDILESLITKYNEWITPKALKVNLDVENQAVRGCLDSTARILVCMTLTKSPQMKLEFLLKFFQLTVLALTKSSYGKEISVDEILPALSYIIIKSKITNLNCQLSFISNFSPFKENLDSGEAAYAFLTMNVALEAIKQGLVVPVDEAEDSESDTSIPFTRSSSTRFFETSITVIQNKVEETVKKQRQEIIYCLRQFTLENKDRIARELSDRTEKKWWRVIKWIPGLNVGYGSIRSIVYTARGNKAMAVESLVGTVGGILGLGAGIAGGLVGGPIIVPVLVSLVSGSATNQVATGGGELLVDLIRQPNDFKVLSDDERETEVYERVLRDIAIIGGLYSAVRSVVYLGKGKAKEAKASGVGLLVNTGATLVGVAVGVGMSKLASSMTKVPSATAAAAAAVEGVDDVVKPLSTELVDVVRGIGMRIATQTSTNTAVHVSSNALTLMALENLQGRTQHGDDTVF